MSEQVSEEEKKAIEWFKSDLEMTKELGKKWGFQEDIKNNEIILNLIEKQQKEIEEKNCLIDVLQHRIEELLDNKKEINYIKPIDIPVHNYINKDKIREKIEEARKIKWHTPKLVIEYFEELLEEK